MQADKYQLVRFARTCLRLFQPQQINPNKQQTRLLTQLGSQRNQLNFEGGTGGTGGTILASTLVKNKFTASTTSIAGIYLQQRYQHAHLFRLQSNTQNQHNNFRQPHANICTQSITSSCGKYPIDTAHEPLSTERARELIYKLKDSEREALSKALAQYQSDSQRAIYEGMHIPGE